jgi:hypothetical protein
MCRRFFLEIPAPVFSRLAQLASEERRPVRDQAVVLIEQALGARPPLVPMQLLAS